MPYTGYQFAVCPCDVGDIGILEQKRAHFVVFFRNTLAGLDCEQVVSVEPKVATRNVLYVFVNKH